MRPYIHADRPDIVSINLIQQAAFYIPIQLVKAIQVNRFDSSLFWIKQNKKLYNLENLHTPNEFDFFLSIFF